MPNKGHVALFRPASLRNPWYGPQCLSLSKTLSPREAKFAADIRSAPDPPGVAVEVAVIPKFSNLERTCPRAVVIDRSRKSCFPPNGEYAAYSIGSAFLSCSKTTELIAKLP